MNKQNQTWEDLRLVLSIAKGNGLSGASRILGLHHATVLRRLNSFEKRMGVILFERDPKGYTPTRIGEDIALIASRIEQNVDDAYRQIAGQDMRLSGTIRFATSDFIAQTLLPPILHSFRQKYPSIEIEVNISPQYASLTNREADVAIRTVDSQSDSLIEALTGKSVAQITYGIYGHNSLIKQIGPTLDIEQLDWVGVDHTLNHVSTNQWRLQRYPNAKVHTRFDSLIGIYNAINSAMGIGFLPHFMAVQNKQLVCLATEPDKWILDLLLLIHPDMRQMNRVRAFFQVAEKGLRTYRLSEVDETSKSFQL